MANRASDYALVNLKTGLWYTPNNRYDGRSAWHAYLFSRTGAQRMALLHALDSEPIAYVLIGETSTPQGMGIRIGRLYRPSGKPYSAQDPLVQDAKARGAFSTTPPGVQP